MKGYGEGASVQRAGLSTSTASNTPETLVKWKRRGDADVSSDDRQTEGALTLTLKHPRHADVSSDDRQDRPQACVTVLYIAVLEMIRRFRYFAKTIFN